MIPSKRIARITGPVLIALAPTEAANLGAFTGNPAPVVYLNGARLFAAGVAILQAHPRWAADWTALVTLTGWGMVALGLYRMAAPAGPLAAQGPATSAALAALFVMSLVLTWRGYVREARVASLAHGHEPGTRT